MPELPPVRVKVEFDGHELETGAVQMELFGREAERSMTPASNAIKNLGGDVEREAKKVVTSLDDVDKSSKSAHLQLLDLGRAGVQPANALIAIAVAAALTLAPLAAFTAGLAGALALGTAVFGGMTILGAGVVALAAHYGNWSAASKDVEDAQKKLEAATRAVHDAVHPTRLQLIHLREAQEALTEAQKAAQNPLTTLVNGLDDMAKALGEQATPAAASILGWLSTLIPTVQTLGSELIDWFGERLPKVMPILTRIFNDFIFVLEHLGSRIGPIFDAVIGKPETIERAFHTAFKGAADAVVILLEQLGELTKWWGQHGPELQTVAGGTLQILGNMILGAATAVGILASWFNAIDPILKGVWDTIGEGITFALPLLGAAIDAFHLLDPVLQFIREHADSLRPVLLAVGVLLVVMASSAILTAGTIVLLTAGIIAIISAISAFVDWLRRTGEQGGFFVSILGQMGVAAQGVIRWVEGAIGSLSRLRSAILNMPGLGGILPYGIGGFQHGGIALPGQVFTVGEAGPEMGYAIPGGGVAITPGGGSGGGSGRPIVINIIGAGQSEEQVAMATARRLGGAFVT